MGQQGRLNCDNLKWLCIVPLLGKQKQNPSSRSLSKRLQLTQSICIKPSHTTLGTSPHGHYMELVNLLGFPGGKESAGKETACNAGDLGLIPGLGRSPGEGNSYPLQYSCLGNPVDREAWWATVHRVVSVQSLGRVRHFVTP